MKWPEKPAAKNNRETIGLAPLGFEQAVRTALAIGRIPPMPKAPKQKAKKRKAKE